MAKLKLEESVFNGWTYETHNPRTSTTAVVTMAWRDLPPKVQAAFRNLDELRTVEYMLKYRASGNHLVQSYRRIRFRTGGA